jgi:hypothetical protein
LDNLLSYFEVGSKDQLYRNLITIYQEGLLIKKGGDG